MVPHRRLRSTHSYQMYEWVADHRGPPSYEQCEICAVMLWRLMSLVFVPFSTKLLPLILLLSRFLQLSALPSPAALLAAHSSPFLHLPFSSILAPSLLPNAPLFPHISQSPHSSVTPFACPFDYETASGFANLGWALLKMKKQTPFSKLC